MSRCTLSVTNTSKKCSFLSSYGPPLESQCIGSSSGVRSSRRGLGVGRASSAHAAYLSYLDRDRRTVLLCIVSTVPALAHLR